MASVHTTVTVQAFNGLEPGMVGDFLCAYPIGGGSLKDMHVYLRRRHIRQVRIRTPGEDTYAR